MIETLSRPPAAPLSPDEVLVKDNSETMERELVFGLARSRNFYVQARETLCPYDAKKQKHRLDFTVDRYNTLYRAIDGWWRRFDHVPQTQDLNIPPHLLSAYMADWCNHKQIKVETATALITEIADEAGLAAAITYDSSMALFNSAGFRHWLNERIMHFTMEKLNTQKAMGLLTLDTMEEAFTNARNSSPESALSSFYNGGDLLLSRRKYSAAIPTDLNGLNRAMGGGFRRGETTMVAAINGGGKTVLSCQFAQHLAAGGYKVAVFSTERKPYEMAYRVISNYANVPLNELLNYDSEFMDRTVVADDDQTLVPDYMWQDPRYADKMKALLEIMTNNLVFVDWSEGKGNSIVGNFDASILKMEQLGWSPDAVVFDWIGGGLGKDKDVDKLRHLYQAGVDHLVNHGKRTGRVMTVAAQLDKMKVTAHTKYTSMNMVAECKGMTNNITNFIGISSIRSRHLDETMVLDRSQFLTVDKATLGPKGMVPVEQCFEFQRIANRNSGTLNQ